MMAVASVATVCARASSHSGFQRIQPAMYCACDARLLWWEAPVWKISRGIRCGINGVRCGRGGRWNSDWIVAIAANSCAKFVEGTA